MEVKTSNKERLEDSYLLTTGLYFEEPILKKGIMPFGKTRSPAPPLSWLR